MICTGCVHRKVQLHAVTISSVAIVVLAVTVLKPYFPNSNFLAPVFLTGFNKIGRDSERLFMKRVKVSNKLLSSIYFC